MSNVKYYTYTKIKGNESEELLVSFRDLYNSKKITDNLPQNTKTELTSINNILELLIKKDNEDLIICGGKY